MSSEKLIPKMDTCYTVFVKLFDFDLNKDEENADSFATLDEAKEFIKKVLICYDQSCAMETRESQSFVEEHYMTDGYISELPKIESWTCINIPLEDLKLR